jgi:hypothetical protein
VTLSDAVRFSGGITARSFRVAYFRRLAAASIADPQSSGPAQAIL